MILAATCLGLAVAGCGERKFVASDIVVATRSVTVAPSMALVALPPGGPPVVSVTQRSFDNGVSQVITLSTRGRTAGENAVHVAFLTAADLPESTGVEGNLLREPGIEDFEIAAEMEERLPGVAMAPSAIFVQNRYGPFGYAFGRGNGGEACIYAWQRMANGDSIFRPRSGVISVRIRVCDPRATEASLLRLAYDYSVNASLARAGWNPIGDGPAPAAGLGETGHPIYPVPQASFPDLGEPRPTPARARPARQPLPDTRRSEPPDSVPDRPLEGYPTVPPPPAP